MPGRRGRDAPVDTTLCRRCQTNEPDITVRTEPLCTPCFGKYVSTKVVKRMESFRVRHADLGKERQLLLPLSLGTCSTTLLYVLDQHLKGQAGRTGRTGYKLHVLHVRESQVDLPSSTEPSPVLAKVRDRFSDHVHSVISLSDVFLDEGLSEIWKQEASPETSLKGESQKSSTDDKLSAMLNSMTSATSRADMVQILLRKVITNFAEQNACEAILWGDSTTRLAERTLAETAKGRGFALPWIMADGEALQGVPSYYPMRDLLSKEMTTFGHLVDPPLDDCIVQKEIKASVSTKNTTIDDLMRQYFESVEREYPSIVANVVKTTGKLQIISLDQIEQRCELCDMPLDGAAPERSRLCYGCVRVLPRASE